MGAPFCVIDYPGDRGSHELALGGVFKVKLDTRSVNWLCFNRISILAGITYGTGSVKLESYLLEQRRTTPRIRFPG